MHLYSEKQASRGFTIIETMLVLAVTGMLLAGLFVGIGTAIGTQRYRDSVTSFQSLLQDQYSLTQNVSNDREGIWVCGQDAAPVEQETQNTELKNAGQTDCVVLGRYVSINGQNITTSTVIGYGDTGSASANDIEVLRGYRLSIAETSIETDQLSWSSEIYRLGSSNARSFSFLVLRSPVSGISFTFTGTSGTVAENMTSERLSELVASSSSATPARQVLCIDPSGYIVPERMAVGVNASASGASSIETLSADTLRSFGETQRC